MDYTNPTTLASTLEGIKDIAKNAGELILTAYQNRETIHIKSKPDASPVTDADIQSHNHIQASLQTLTPRLPILSEESELPTYDIRKQWDSYWLVDPLDGTKEFIQGTDEFVVSIALIHQGKAILGVLYSPVNDVFYYGVEGQGAFKQAVNQTPTPIQVADTIFSPVKICISRHHYTQRLFDYLDSLGPYDVQRVGSALKFGLVAEGQVNLYPCLGKTSEWDTAAGQCIVEAAGGAVLDFAGNPLRYNEKEDILNSPFIVTNDKDYDWLDFFQN